MAQARYMDKKNVYASILKINVAYIFVQSDDVIMLGKLRTIGIHTKNKAILIFPTRAYIRMIIPRTNLSENLKTVGV